MPVLARNFVRKMRGGAQAHLVEGDDGHLYVVKFTNNPQHRRILVNEWLCCSFLRYLQIFVPETSLVQLTTGFLADNPEVAVSVASQTLPPPPGVHFGSRMAVHPDRVSIWDFLPDKTLGSLENRTDFLGMLVFDKWVANADSRQAVFFRARAKGWTPLKGEAPARVGFFAQMIDHGFAFQGAQWQFHDAPLQGIYFRTAVYNEVQSLSSFEPWIEMIANFPLEVVDSAWKEIPREWLQGDDDALEQLLELLLKRRSRVADLIRDVREKRASTFPNWR